MAPGWSGSAARWGAGCAWAFAALLGFVALRLDLSVFEGVSWPRLALSALFLGGCAAYAIWLRAALRGPASEPRDFAHAVAPGWPILAAALLAAPISTDSLLYLHYGAMVLAGKNPYLEPSSAMRSAFSALVQWDQTCVYGPVSLALFALSATLRSALLGVICLKLLWLAGHLAGAYACWHSAGERRALWARAFAFNPVLLLAFVVDVHVDALTCGLLLWSFVLLARERALAALGLLCAAVLSKSVALLGLPLWFAWALSRRRYALAAQGAALLGLLVALLALSLFPTAAAWSSLANPIANTGRSIQHVLVLSGQWFDFDGARAAARYAWGARVAYLVGAAAVWFRALRAGYDAAALARDFALLLLLACLFVVPFVPWWYGALVLAAALWSPRAARLRPAAMTFGVCAAVTLSAGSGISKAGLVSALLAITPTTLVLLRSARAEASR